MNSYQKKYYNLSSIQSVQRRQYVATQIQAKLQELVVPNKSDEIKLPPKVHEENKTQAKSNTIYVENSISSQKLCMDFYQEDFLQDYDSNIYQDTVIKQHEKITIDGVEYDIYGNQEGEEFDLGKDGAFNDFSVLAGIFYQDVFYEWNNTVGAALEKQGFKSDITTNEIDFIQQLNSLQHDVAIIISNCKIEGGIEDRFRQAVIKFHHDKRGLFVFGDNEPYYDHANSFLPQICQTQLVGNNPGENLLKFGDDPTQAGYFDKTSMIFAGINSLFEGITICYPENVKEIQVLATGGDGQPCICQKQRSDIGGRIVIDTGFTKLYINWDSAGQARYIINACVYLVDIEGRFGGEQPTKIIRSNELDSDLQEQIEQLDKKTEQNKQIKKNSPLQKQNQEYHNLPVQSIYQNHVNNTLNKNENNTIKNSDIDNNSNNNQNKKQTEARQPSENTSNQQSSCLIF